MQEPFERFATLVFAAPGVRTIFVILAQSDFYCGDDVRHLMNPAPLAPCASSNQTFINLNRIFVIQPYVKGIYHYPILGRTFLKYVQIEKH